MSGFHASLGGPTPLVELRDVARELRVGRVFVKDEGDRWGLPSFKILGVSWAVSRVLADHREATGRTGPESRQVCTLDDLREWVQDGPAPRLVTASDGNHGRALAAMGRSVGLPVTVYLPRAVDGPAAEAIKSEGAEVTRVEGDYDTAVARAAAVAAESPAAVLVQDTSWPGYERVPQWIVDGYSTLFREVDAQLASLGAGPVEVMIVPVGVGSLAQSAVTHVYRDEALHRARLVSVEPRHAASTLASLVAGERRSIQTGPTRLQGLACGTPSSLAWPFLRHGLDAATTVTDAASASASLAAWGVPAGLCGAATLAAAREVARTPVLREHLELRSTATVVLLSTEGPTSGGHVGRRTS